jgi:hypothetical protein
MLHSKACFKRRASHVPNALEIIDEGEAQRLKQALSTLFLYISKVELSSTQK